MKQKVLEYFTQISQIPHETYCEKQLAEYVCSFAKQHNFEYFKDSYNNVIVNKIVNPSKPITVLQAHLDMVCVKDADYDFDFSSNPLKLKIKDDYLFAHKTSLGADNGIGVAIILAMLESSPYNIQALFTTDEECTMTGALNFDYSLLKSKDIISLDGFSDKKMILGCASICDSNVKLNSNCSILGSIQKGYKLTVSGLKGGHSGADIDKNVGNAVKVFAELLNCFSSVNFDSFEVGDQFNFIPNYGVSTFSGVINKEKFDEISLTLKNKYKGLKIKLESAELIKEFGLDFSSKLIEFINKIQAGVIVKNGKKVVMSQNLASVSLANDLVKISERSHCEKTENDNIKLNKNLCNLFGFDFEIFDKQPGFETSKNCSLAQNLLKASKSLNYTLTPITKHISTEGCIFKLKMKDANIVVVSPTIKGAHSTKERVYLPSIQKTTDLLDAYFKNLK